MKKLFIRQQVEFVKTLLRNNTSTPQVHTVFKNKWEAATHSQINYRLKTARRELYAEQKEITDRAQLVVLKAVEERAIDIMGLAERKQILSQIARGEFTIARPVMVDGQLQYIDTLPDFKQRIAAITELNRIDGTYATNRTAIATNYTASTAAIIHFNGEEVELLG